MDLRTQLQTSVGTAYVIERELGGGGMSRVFLAEERALGRKVVVKVLSPELTAGVDVGRFHREIQLSAKLQHPHIVPVLSAGEFDGVPYYTMPYVEGESLRGRLSRAGALDLTEAVSVLRDIARALAYAHERGVVHRDIKPDNVLLSGGSATVADFGIAKAISAAREHDTGATLTQMGTSIGTPAYMAPEQAAADPATDHRADLYSFGCVAYEVLAGRAPFAGKTPQHLLAAQMSERPRAITELRGDTPPALAQLVMHCLEKDPDHRPQSAAAIVRVLETATASGDSATSAAFSESAGSLRKALLWYTVAFALVLIATQAAVMAIGLPDWVVPGATAVMLLGLPVILFTGFVQRVARRASSTPGTLTPGGTPTAHDGPMSTFAMKASRHFNWHRAMRGGVFALGAFVVLVAAFMGLRALGIGPFGSLLAAGKLEHRDPLLLTDFRVVNGDSTLGPVISQAVRSNLEQSAVVALVSREEIANGLQRMQQPTTSRLDLQLARSLGQREGIRAVVDGEIAGIGTGFLITLRLVTADSGRELASFREAADSPRELIEAVDALSRKLRERIGESLRTVRGSPALALVTTPSIEALRKYTEAMRAMGTGDGLRSAALAREAIAIDSNFALAYRQLFEALNVAGQKASADSAITRAFEMRDRLTERERLAVLGDYYGLGPGRDRGKAIDAFTRQVEMGEYSNTNSLGNLLASRREFARAESLARERIRVQPDFELTYTNLISFLLYQNKTDAADSVLAVAQARKTVHPNLGLDRAYIAVHRDSVTRALVLLDSLAHLGPQNAAYYKALLMELRGRVTASRATIREAFRAMRASGTGCSPGSTEAECDAFWALQDSLMVAHQDARLFDRKRNLRHLTALVSAVSSADRPGAQSSLAWSLAALDDPAQARLLYDQWSATVRDTVERRLAEPGTHGIDSPNLPALLVRQATEARRGAWILARIALAERRFDDAIVEFRKADLAHDGPADACAACLPFDLARTFDKKRNVDSALHYMERVFEVANPSTLYSYGMLIPTLHERAGQLYEERGDREKAYAHFARFVDYWSDPDPELRPRVEDARRRMARLRSDPGD